MLNEEMKKEITLAPADPAEAGASVRPGANGLFVEGYDGTTAANDNSLFVPEQAAAESNVVVGPWPGSGERHDGERDWGAHMIAGMSAAGRAAAEVPLTGPDAPANFVDLAEGTYDRRAAPEATAETVERDPDIHRVYSTTMRDLEARWKAADAAGNKEEAAALEAEAKRVEEEYLAAKMAPEALAKTPEEKAVAERGPELSPDEEARIELEVATEAKKFVAKPEAEKMEIGLCAANAGFKLDEWKNNKLAAAFGGAAKWFSEPVLTAEGKPATDKDGQPILRPKNMMGRFLSALANQSLEENKSLRRQMEAMEKDKGSLSASSAIRAASNIGRLTGNAFKYGRMIGDAVGFTAAMSLRYVTMGAMFGGKVFGGAKEARLSGENVAEKTRLSGENLTC